MKYNGVSTRLITPPADKTKPQQFIDELVHSPPACTFCINGILPDKEENFLADLLQIPHVAYIVDTPTVYYSLCNSDFTLIASIDQEFQNIFSEIKGGNVFFLPGAAPNYVDPVPAIQDRSIDVLMVPHLIDPIKIKEDWFQTYPKKFVEFLIDSAETALNLKHESFTTAFLQGWDIFSPQEQQEFTQHRSLPLIHELEMYMRGVDQIEILKSFEGMDVELLIPHGTKAAWQKILKELSANFSFVEGVDFDTIFHKLKESKIFIHSSPQIKYGSDGWPFVALLGGCYVFTTKNNWLDQRYYEENGIYFYTFKDLNTIRDKAKTLLSNPDIMDQSILIGRNKVIQEDTWNTRAKQLLESLPTHLAPLAARGKFYKKGT
jgi:glycosyltransferase involved in cell wall biosynthesis